VLEATRAVGATYTCGWLCTEQPPNRSPPVQRMERPPNRSPPAQRPPAPSHLAPRHLHHVELVHEPAPVAADARALHVEPELREALHHLDERAGAVGAVDGDDGAVVVGLVVDVDLGAGAVGMGACLGAVEGLFRAGGAGAGSGGWGGVSL